MKSIFTYILLLFLVLKINGQSPVKILYQPNQTYTETFDDIKNWAFDVNNTGNFTSGIGSSTWKGLSVSGSGTIPNAPVITNSSTYFTNLFNSGVQKDTTGKSLILLASGTVDNTTSAGMDFYADFSNSIAGTLSFNWQSVNNYSGDRKASLRVYASTNGINFSEVSGAQVLNFTNNSVTTGSIINVALPASFDNSPTARLRFYYHNGVGGSNGSRPKISIDNVKITATVATACQQPGTQPTNLIFSAVTDSSFNAFFTASTSPWVNSYIIVQSYNAALTSLPVSGNYYQVGDNIGDGDVIAITPNANFSVSNLYPATGYYFYVFAVHYGCASGPLYETINPLTGNITTLAGNNACSIPTTQPSALNFPQITSSKITGSFTISPDADEYLIVQSTSSPLTATPVKGVIYKQGDVLGNGIVVSRGLSNLFISTGLIPFTTYYFFAFSVKSLNCNNGPSYNTVSPLTGTSTTLALTACITPTDQPTLLNLSSTNNLIQGFFLPSGSADSYLIVYGTSPALGSLPQDGVNYTTGNSLGSGIVLSNSSSTSLVAPNLSPGITYYFFVFSANKNCLNGPNYLTTNPLMSSAITTTVSISNIYFGNLHAHSSYSDGNKDNLSNTPAFNYNYAKNSLCMDFLGISEHNHVSAGMNYNNWRPGINQSKAATTSTFLALYGMEWGVISGGGHVLVYGSDQLYGWDFNNYDVYVPVNNYTGTPATTNSKGLFRTINEAGGNVFGTLAHPYIDDYNNLLNLPYNPVADSALVGVAIESGPAFSTNTSYSDGSYMQYLTYYSGLLAKGYHAGPTIDHDNHYTTFGRTTRARLAVIAPTLDSASFYRAMKGRNFYATEDCDIRVTFSLNGHQMGSIVSEETAPSIVIYAYDFVPSTPAGTPVIKLMYGIPGSNILATEIAVINGSTLTFTDDNLQTGTTGYYYADITMSGNGARILTSPIWYTRTNNIIPLTLLTFTATPLTNQSVKLQWTTAKEINFHNFIIERSFNGKDFSAIGKTNSRGQENNRYDWIDFSPIDGINYYRIRMVNNDGSFRYTKTIAINFKTIGINTFKIVENPSHSVIRLQINSIENQNISIVITDESGRINSRAKATIVKGNQIISLKNSNLSRGVYFVTLQFKDERLTGMFMKL